jgi:hypothetical protein
MYHVVSQVTVNGPKRFTGHKKSISFARFKDLVLAHSHVHFIPMYIDPNCTCTSNLRTIGSGQSLKLDGLEGGPLSILEMSSLFGSPFGLRFTRLSLVDSIRPTEKDVS